MKIIRIENVHLETADPKVMGYADVVVQLVEYDPEARVTKLRKDGTNPDGSDKWANDTKAQILAPATLRLKGAQVRKDRDGNPFVSVDNLKLDWAHSLEIGDAIAAELEQLDMADRGPAMVNTRNPKPAAEASGASKPRKTRAAKQPEYDPDGVEIEVPI